jgi:uncharacterized protein
MVKMEHKCHEMKKPWYKERIYHFFVLVFAVLIISYLVSFLNPLFDAFIDYLKLIWWAILLGLILGGIIDYFIPKEYISKYLAKDEKKTIFYATIFGFLMSACSHGILAISIELYKKGASVPAVISFLLASPWANLPMTIMLFGFFGVKALYLIGFAILIAIITGLVFQVLSKKGMIERNKKVHVKKDFSIWKDFKRRFKKYDYHLVRDIKGVVKGGWNLAKMVLWWILLGMLMASAARAFVPVDFFHKYMGASLLGLGITLAIAIIIEVCSEGTSPVAFEIYKQTGAFGNSFVFLMAGVATDYTELGLIWSNIGKKAAIWLPIIAAPQIIILGYLFNVFI